MLTFISPKDRVLLRLLKPKVAAWRWFTRARGLAGMPVVRHEYLESVLRSQIQNYDLFNVTAGFEFEDGVYKIKITTASDGIVDRECHSLLEVATIAAFKFRSWMGTEVSNVPQFATAALNSLSPGDFIEKFLQLRRVAVLEYLRAAWFIYLTLEKSSQDITELKIRCAAGILFANYESAHSTADVSEYTDGELEALGIDKRAAYEDVFDRMKPLIIRNLQLHKPHAYHLYPLCETEDELRLLLSGEMGFLRAKRAFMSANQLDYMLGSELGL